MKTTPGPWIVSHHKGAGNVFRLDNEMSAREFVETMEGNLLLVQAAPELFDALERILAEAEIDLLDSRAAHVVDAAKIAIAKAQGKK